MKFGYEKKLLDYQKNMTFLNENIYDTLKIRNLLNYARSNGIINEKNYFMGELEAIYEFYLLDFNKQMNKAKSCTEEEKKKYYERADADMMVIDSLTKNNHIKENYEYIYKSLMIVEKLDKYIKEEDKIPFKQLDIKKL